MNLLTDRSGVDPKLLSNRRADGGENLAKNPCSRAVLRQAGPDDEMTLPRGSHLWAILIAVSKGVDTKIRSQRHVIGTKDPGKNIPAVGRSCWGNGHLARLAAPGHQETS